MQITKQLIDEFESEFPSSDRIYFHRGDIGLYSEYRPARYDYECDEEDAVLRECAIQNARLEVWLKQREKVEKLKNEYDDLLDALDKSGIELEHLTGL